MHEMSIAKGILDIVLDTAQDYSASAIHQVNLLVGKMSGIEPDSLHFCFDAVTKGTIAEGARLNIQETSIEGYCIQCERNFSVEEYDFHCPHCKSGMVNVISGRELKVLSIDMD